MTDFAFDDRARAEARYLFAAGGSWARYRADPEAMRWWWAFREEPAVVMLCSDALAVIELRLDGDRVAELRLLEPAASEAALRAWGFRTPAAVRQAIERALPRGRAIDDALAEPVGQRLGLGALPAPAGLRRFRIAGAGVVEVPVDGDGRAASPLRWLEGGDALDAVRAARRGGGPGGGAPPD